MKTVKVSEAGSIMRVCVYSKGSKWDSETARKAKKMCSTEARKRINLLRSEQKMAESVAANFDQGDFHVVFTLSDAFLTQDYRVLKKYWQLFLNRIRKARAARGAGQLRYIYVMEGLHGDHRPHIHALLKAADLDADGWAEIRKHWFYGSVEETAIANWEHRYEIGRYLSKEPRKHGRIHVGQRIFDCSRNLQRPRRTSYSLQDADSFQIPDGYEIVVSDCKNNPFGTFEYYVLKRKGSIADTAVWMQQAHTSL